MKRIVIFTVLLVFCFLTNKVYSEDLKKVQNSDPLKNSYNEIGYVEDIIDLKFIHSLQFFIRSGKKKSPVLWEKDNIQGDWKVASQLFPTISYGRSGQVGGSFDEHNVSVSFDFTEFMDRVNENNKLANKVNYTEQELLKEITSLYAKSVNKESIYLQMEQIYFSKQKILKEFEKFNKRGGIADYKLTELKLEILQLGLEINTVKNELIETLLQLHFISGVKLKSKS